MNEQQLMQQNLAKIFNSQVSCHSLYEQKDQQPTNPFEKRAFEKRLRRSSVISENINPNYSLKNVVTNYMDQISSQTITLKIQIDLLEQEAKLQLKRVYEESNDPCEVRQFFQQIKQKLNHLQYELKNNFICQNYVSQSKILKSNQELSSNIYNMPNSLNNKYFKLSSTSHSKSVQYVNQKQEKQAETESYYHNDNTNSRVKKSIYEMVLEERKQKKIKKHNVRII